MSDSTIDPQITQISPRRAAAKTNYGSSLKKHLNTKAAYGADPKQCPYCQKVISYERRKNKFCNQSCAARFYLVKQGKIAKTAIKFCVICGKPTPNMTACCSRRCANAKKASHIIDAWLTGKTTGADNGKHGNLKKPIKKYLIKKAGEKCEQCGWSEKNPVTNNCPLAVDHIDGNSSNHSPLNLRVLCPNCHSLTPTYGSLNKGNGRKYRRKAKIEQPRESKPQDTPPRCRCGKTITTSSRSGLCHKCFSELRRKTTRPSHDELIALVSKLGYLQTGKQFGVSNSTIKKWLKASE